jgi:hypothetical protein
MQRPELSEGGKLEVRLELVRIVQEAGGWWGLGEMGGVVWRLRPRSGQGGCHSIPTYFTAGDVRGKPARGFG